MPQPLGQPLAFRRNARGALLALMTALTVTVAGCAAKDSSDASPAPAATALSYTKALFAGKFRQASTYVLPSDRGVLDVLFTGLSSGSMRAENLQAGKAFIDGAHGQVVLTGKVCSSGAVPKKPTKASRAREACTTNKDPASKSNPAFLVSICKKGEAWYVCFPKPEQQAGTSERSTASTPASP